MSYVKIGQTGANINTFPVGSPRVFPLPPLDIKKLVPTIHHKDPLFIEENVGIINWLQRMSDDLFMNFSEILYPRIEGSVSLNLMETDRLQLWKEIFNFSLPNNITPVRIFTKPIYDYFGTTKSIISLGGNFGIIVEVLTPSEQRSHSYGRPIIGYTYVNGFRVGNADIYGQFVDYIKSLYPSEFNNNIIKWGRLAVLIKSFTSSDKIPRFYNALLKIIPEYITFLGLYIYDSTTDTIIEYTP